MANVTPDQAAQAWASGLANKTDRITAGVQAVKVSPGAAAARQRAVWLANLQAKADKWARNVGALSLQDWQAAMTNKGIPRIAQGAQAAQPKFAAFMGRLLPYQDRLVGTLPARGTLEQNIARMTQFVRGMANFNNTQG